MFGPTPPIASYTILTHTGLDLRCRRVRKLCLRPAWYCRPIKRCAVLRVCTNRLGGECTAGAGSAVRDVAEQHVDRHTAPAVIGGQSQQDRQPRSPDGAVRSRPRSGPASNGIRSLESRVPAPGTTTTAAAAATPTAATPTTATTILATTKSAPHEGTEQPRTPKRPDSELVASFFKHKLAQQFGDDSGGEEHHELERCRSGHQGELEQDGKPGTSKKHGVHGQERLVRLSGGFLWGSKQHQFEWYGWQRQQGDQGIGGRR